MEKIDFKEIFCLPDFFESGRELVLYGAGARCEYIYEKLKEYDVLPAEICDSFKVGEEFKDYKICSIEEVIENYDNPKILITSSNYYDEIQENLLTYVDEKCLISPLVIWSMGFKDFIKEHQAELKEVYNLLDDEESKRIFTQVLKGRSSLNYEIFKEIQVDNQYFVEDIVKLTDNECFIDCGAYTGDTLDDFIRHTNNKFSKAYCFEPSADTFDELKKVWGKHGHDERVVLEQSGLYHKTTKIGFVDHHLSAGNAINVESADQISVVSIDEFIKEPVTFIKMDIEGAELDALKGAKETILKYKPKLAISIYHKYEDYFEIPKYISELNLGYRFYMRHHTDCQGDTILYAI